MSAIELFPAWTGTAEFSNDGVYRYSLTRRWAVGPTAVWILLNPSTADEVRNDPTIRRVMGFSRAWGYGGFTLMNVFALRSTDPSALRTHPDPTGPDNDETIRRVSGQAELVVAAWGTLGALRQRGAAVRAMLGRVQCLGTTKAGFPRHPLYTAADQQLVEFS